MRLPYPNELYHHGVSGMKWGVRNGPPYPLYEGKGNSKAVQESKKNFGPKAQTNKFRQIAKQKGFLRSTNFENTMATKTKQANTQYEYLSSKADKMKDGRRKDRTERRAAEAKALVDRYNEAGAKYESLSLSEQKAVSRGYNYSRELLRAAQNYAIKQAREDFGTSTTDRSYYNARRSRRATDYAANRAIDRIEEAYNKK